MLGIGKLAAGAEDYYLGIAAGIEDYYVGLASPGRWIGSSNRVLGLDGEVDPDHLRSVFAGLDPTSGTPLVRSANRTVVAFDLTFKADKSVSLLHAFAGPDVAVAVETAHGAAVVSAMRFLDEHAVYTRRGHNGTETIHGDGMLAASFRHYRNRNDEPHLHDHVLVPNMVKGADDRWSTLDARHLYTHAKTAGYIYQAVLRDQLTGTIGVEFGPVTNGVAPIEGIPRTAIDAFSTRRAEILEHLESLGASSAKAAQIATLQTRRSKDPEPNLDSLQAEWRTRAIANGLDPDRLDQLRGRVEARGLTEAERRHAAEQFVSPAGLTAHAASFDRRDLMRAWCEAHPQGATLAEVEFLTAQMIANEPSLVPLVGERWTTQDLLACERSVLDNATRRLGCGAAVVPRPTADAAIAACPTITTEQQQVARALVEGGDGVSVLIAPAGTGKGFTLSVARAAWAAADVKVLGATIAARAASELRNGSGIESMTITSLIAQLADGRALARNSVLVIDEAGMVGTRQLARLVDHAATRQAKVVLVGDPRQLPEIDAGGLLGGLAKHVPILTLTENRRQREPWERAALNQFRSGSVDKALDAFENHGRIERITTLPDVLHRMVEAWATARSDGEQPIMLAARRQDVRALNEIARATMIPHLSGPALVADGAPFQAGDHVMTLRNNQRLDVRNGERGVVQTINVADRSMTVQMTGRTVKLPLTYLEAGHVSHAYAMTVHKAQGVTADRAFVLGTDDLYREMGYVAMSRGRNGNHLFVVGEPTREIEPIHGPSVERANEELFAAALSTSRAQEMATTHINPLAALDDRALVEKWREARDWVQSIPFDQSRDVRSREADVERLESALRAQKTRLAKELSTPRSLRDTLARRDDRGTETDRTITSIEDKLATANTGLRTARTSEDRRASMLRQRPDAVAVRDELDAEIERRVGHRADVQVASPSPYVERRIGKRPDDARIDTWIGGVRTIERVRFENDITSQTRTFGKHDEDWFTRHHLDAVRREIDPPQRSRGLRM